MDKFDQLRLLLLRMEPVFERFYCKGDMSASKTLLKGMQEIKVIAQAVRMEVSERRSA